MRRHEVWRTQSDETRPVSRPRSPPWSRMASLPLDIQGSRSASKLRVGLLPSQPPSPSLHKINQNWWRPTAQSAGGDHRSRLGQRIEFGCSNTLHICLVLVLFIRNYQKWHGITVVSEVELHMSFGDAGVYDRCGENNDIVVDDGNNDDVMVVVTWKDSRNI